jgi:tetratricopeptide (TPR) repeat protein
MAQSSAQPRPEMEDEIDRATALHRQGRLDDAAQIYHAILAASPDRPDILNLLGLARHQQGRNVEALRLIASALKQAANVPDILNNYGLVLGALGRSEEAVEYFERALATRSGHVNALTNRADLLTRLKRDEEALGAYHDLLAAHPDHLGALNESGWLHLRLGRPEAALACYDRALAVSPSVELHVNRGTALRAMNRDEEALTSFAAAAALKPDCAEAHWNASLVRLRQGDFAGGWSGYEWRWRKADWAGAARAFPAPLWLGEPSIAGKTVLLHAEQGLGDTVQFVRYVSLIAGCGATVIVECQPPLKRLLQNVRSVSCVISRGEPVPRFDLHCPLLSLPLAFKTELASVPAEVPYIRACPEHIAKWRGRLPWKARLRVGICWGGSRAHLNDRNRSIPLDRFAKILSIPDIDFVSLQQEVSEPQAALLRHHGVLQLGSEFEDFADTAAVVAMLDMVVAVDTSVPHLAGAMGKVTALLVPFSPDWRWLLDRTDSPWYPTMRLFRQPAIGDWESPLERLRQELVEAARRGSSAHRSK